MIKAPPRRMSKISQIRLTGQKISPGINLQRCASLLETVLLVEFESNVNNEEIVSLLMLEMTLARTESVNWRVSPVNSVGAAETEAATCVAATDRELVTFAS